MARQDELGGVKPQDRRAPKPTRTPKPRSGFWRFVRRTIGLLVALGLIGGLAAPPSPGTPTSATPPNSPRSTASANTSPKS